MFDGAEEKSFRKHLYCHDLTTAVAIQTALNERRGRSDLLLDFVVSLDDGLSSLDKDKGRILRSTLGMIVEWVNEVLTLLALESSSESVLAYGNS